MCGIYGIWHTHGHLVDRAQLQGATTRLRHRGPDDEGYLLVDSRTAATQALAGPDTDGHLDLPRLTQEPVASADLAFGFRRLSILDLSPAGHQPMASPDGHHWIVFNGEVYNYLELRQELRARGHTFTSDGDTEVILAAYREWGEDCLRRFNGMWAFAIWDGPRRRLFLSRDRFGIKPLYYTWDGRTLRFASEIKALVGRYGLPFAPDETAIYRYLVGGLLPSPRAGTTFFQGVLALPPGCHMTLSAGQLQTQTYWQLMPQAGSALSADEAVAAYRELFHDALRLQLRSDVTLGTCLSGGVDSSSIVCTLNQMLQTEGLDGSTLGAAQQTFSAVYSSDGPYNERAYIERVVAATGVTSTLTEPTIAQLLQDAEALVWHQDEPFQSTSIFAQWMVMRAVRERGVTVLLDGQGADEALAGYRPFATYLGEQLRQGQFATALTNLVAIQARTGLDPLTLGLRAVALQLPVLLARPLLRRFAPKRSDLSLIEPGLVMRHNHADAADWSPWATNQHLDQHLLELIAEQSLPHLLRYEDRNSMAFSVEARVPFLDHRLVEFSFGGAAPWRIQRGWTKWVLRQAMDGLVPSTVIWRASKIGFETPEAEWLPRWLAAHPDYFAAGVRSAAYLDLAAVRRAIAEGRATTNDKWRLWRWINLELWLNVWATA